MDSRTNELHCHYFCLPFVIVKIHGSAGNQKIHSQIKRHFTVRELIDPNLPRYARGLANEDNLVDCFGGKMTFAGKFFHYHIFKQILGPCVVACIFSPIFLIKLRDVKYEKNYIK